MDIRLLSELLYFRARWKARDRWSRQQIEAHQARALQELRRAAYAGSQFYRQHHAGLFDAPLSQLPAVTKADLMSHFDEAVTDPGLRLADVEEHLRNLVATGTDPGRPWRGRWWAAATAGTTGRRGIFIWNRREWATVLASYARANDWAGVPAGLAHPLRVAMVSSRTPTHQSAVVGASLRSRLVPTLRLDATSPVREIVAALNSFQPRLLVGYASALKPLAAEQRAGGLRISPQSVVSASEVLTVRSAAEIQAAWESAPFDVYAATETAGIASPCVFHTSHIYEDLVIVEPVDLAGLTVPPGTIGARILVTVLFSRTLPLIRYEMSDSVGIDGRGCPCGRSFARLAGIEGRIEDVLILPGITGEVSIHPNVFHNVLDDATIAGWQVIQEPATLRVMLAGLAASASVEQVRTGLAAALESAGVVGTALDVRVVDAVERTALGKAPLVRGLRRLP
ncbi:phenylacetate--CoA ligase family protein [Cryobacterium mannosilyticum]|uniref:Phenylacetate--CoA ligase family protein n=1 Tax=Cryobacterium mannosilyticum TaxID=1259190 RepID=A0A4R8WC67_9MICO|nr:phenylacetate--CoA ligase family protein [Cryobacterium mannosilyticum]TFC06836.1 phenylacetate--CoA ligase family protein [Cryobacterium mannosilyticum]